MAITTVNSGVNQKKGITYTHITDSSVDWTGVTNDTYFYDKATDLPYYKNSGGTVISVFEGGAPSLNNGEVFVGNASNEATSVAMSGDVAITNAGVTTIQSDAVTYDKMQDTTQAALLGNDNPAGGTVNEIPIVDQYLATGTVTALLENTSNWDVNGNYTGASITATYQGQSHYDGNYWFTAVADNVWIRLIRG